MTQPGLLIVGHGTRDAGGRAEFLAAAEAVAAELPEWAVEPCFLELAEPAIAGGMTRLVARGAIEQITVAPLLLFAAGHAKADIPQAVAREATNYPDLRLKQASHLGVHPALVELSKRRYQETLVEGPPAAERETLVVFVGRGSRDPSANAELAQFARLRWEACPTGWMQTCYAALAEPSLERALELAVRLPFRRIVVQPHLLFRGELLSRIRSTVAAFAGDHPEFEWAVTSHLGADRQVVEALVAMVRAASDRA